MCVGHALGKRARLGGAVGPHHAHDLEVEAARNLLAHEVRVVGHISPAAGLVVLAVGVGRAQHLERDAQRIVVGEVDIRIGNLDRAVRAHGAVDQLVELLGVQHADAVERVVADLPARGEHEHRLVRGLRPATGHHVVLRVEQGLVVEHLVEGGGGSHHRARHGAARGTAAHGRRERVGAELHGAGGRGGVGGGGVARAGVARAGVARAGVTRAGVTRAGVARFATRALAEHERRDAVVVLDGVDVVGDAVAAAVEERLEAPEVVGLHAREHVLEHGRLRDGRRAVGLAGIARGGRGRRAARKPHRRVARVRRVATRDHARDVVALPRDLEGVARERVLLHLGDVAVYAVGERQDRRDADDADRAGKGRHEGAALLGHEVVGREGERREQPHRGVLLGGLGSLGAGHLVGKLV